MTDVPEHVYAANQMIVDSTDDLIFDRKRRNTLAGEIRDVLSVLRLRQPWTEEIPVHLEYGPGVVGVGLEAELMERVREATAGERYVGPLATGIPELDELNARLGLRGFWLVSSAEGRDGSISLCLNDRVNVIRAAEEYARIDGVTHAEASGIASVPGFLPEILLKEGDDGWYVIAGRPQSSFSLFSGDLHYFRVSGAVVHEVDPDDAAGMLIFEDLARSSSP